MNRFFTIRAAYGVAAVIALAYFALFLYQHALNIPFHDDIYDVLLFTLDFTSAENFEDAFNALFLQHNEHRTTASRLVYYLLYKLEGEVNFRSLTFVANLAMPIIVITFMLGAQRRADRALVGLVGVLLLCNPRAYNQILWATSAFAFLFVYAYALLALYFLRNKTTLGLSLGLFFAIASTLSLASGKVLWVAGLILLAWQIWGQRARSVWHLLIWGSVATVVLFLYGYNSPSPHTVSWLLQHFWIAPIHVLGYTLGILGSGFCFESLPLALTFGVISCSVLAYIFMQDARDGNLTWLHAFALFVVLSAFAVALGRAHYTYLSYVMEGRYSVLSVIFQLCVFVLACNRGLLRVPWMQSVVVICAAVISVALYRFYSPMVDAKLDRRLLEYDRGVYIMYGIPPARTRAIVLQSIERGHYVPPARAAKSVPGATKKS